MTVDKVKSRVEGIAELKGDDEYAHVEEDKLYEAVLQAIADGTCEDPAGCAREALKTSEIIFNRWCA